MKQLINDYIKKKKIVWNGNKILLFFGGVALGTLLFFGRSFSGNEPHYVYINDSNLLSATVNLHQSDLEDSNFQENVGSNTITTVAPKDVKEEELKNQEVINLSDSSVQNQVQEEGSSKKLPKEEKANSTTEFNTNQTVQETGKLSPNLETSSEQQITIYRKNGAVLTLSMTDYLIGVAAAEMPACFPLESLKAQSVVARTYALKKLASGGKLTDDVSTQVYRDEAYLRSMWKANYDAYYNKIRTAVLTTKDLTLQYQGSYIEAIYHSTSNGRTEDAIHVWENAVPYLRSVESPWDQSAPSYVQTVEKDLPSLFATLGIDFSSPVSLEILSRNESGRISSVRVGDNVYSGVQFRTLLGLRSTDFDLEIESGKLKITTRGYGHGVGMSQYGAKGMAEAGYSYLQILSHYYPGTTLSK